jgi:hypothetical protein
MNSRKVSIALAGAAFCLFGATSSQAAVLTFTVYSGNPNGPTSSDIANFANTPGATHEDATFTYNTGTNLSLNFNDPAPQNTGPNGDLFKTFFGAAGIANISNFSSPDGLYTGPNAFQNFLNANMSVAGNGNTTFFAITGSFNFGAGSNIALTHDDGASFYLLDKNGNPILPAVYSSPQETVAITGNFAVSGQQNFLLDYVAGNGSPSVLELAVAPVPEASTWAMMILGFFGVGFLAYRKKAVVRFA